LEISIWLYEYGKIVEKFPSETAKKIVLDLLGKMKVVEVEKDIIF